MRLPALALVAACLPALARAQLAPRSLALELGFSSDSAPALGSRAPVGLVASWWLAGELDATARASWASAARTDGRAADGAYEAGAGLRYRLARWGSLRPHLAAEVAAVGVLPGSGFSAETGVRLGGGVGLEAFLGREVFLALALQGSELWLPHGGGLGLGAALRAGAYF
ncbi:hypothetical protein [Anaeromyxobacter diazotrophicus]|uniref:Outer membrane protein beta-barrel domain-containing protein n=1 Tax=Anaeromyxobacter diazotrophicus TaxID=2590199 RepID=A0A7I9VPF9_9BACT|nr:hypothetical protein [Anaeromyxobacter diazotrophicus]GEJ58285.1 hypothetical protein AMYX_30260 [Anaeromyxobacter diazotrophicus]